MAVDVAVGGGVAVAVGVGVGGGVAVAVGVGVGAVAVVVDADGVTLAAGDVVGVADEMVIGAGLEDGIGVD